MTGQKPHLFSENSWLDGCHPSCCYQNQYLGAFLDFTFQALSLNPFLLEIIGVWNSSVCACSVCSCPTELSGAPPSLWSPTAYHPESDTVRPWFCATGSQSGVKRIEFWSGLFKIVQISNIQITEADFYEVLYIFLYKFPIIKLLIPLDFYWIPIWNKQVTYWTR